MGAYACQVQGRTGSLFHGHRGLGQTGGKDKAWGVYVCISSAGRANKTRDHRQAERRDAHPRYPCQRLWESTLHSLRDAGERGIAYTTL